MAHVMVVDDEPEIVKMVTKIMEARGHRVTTARDGAEAIETAERELPDVMILDLNLPKIDGFEVCKRLKTGEKTKKIPIVMLTAAYVSVQDADRGVGVGADEYVIKPFLREVLVHNVERLLSAAAAAASSGS
jgi:DNA-binding response OmpR family regulator